MNVNAGVRGKVKAFRSGNAGHRRQRGKTMKRIVQILMISMTLVMAGCAEPGRYPVTGEECKPDDPVKDLSAPDCIVPAS